MAQKYLNLRDMFDGGGAGQSGDSFSGGSLSGLGNLLFKPLGYFNRQRAASQAAPVESPPPQARPVQAQPRQRPVTRPKQTEPKINGLDASVRPQARPEAAPTPSFEDFLAMLPDVEAMKPLEKIQTAYQRNVDAVQKDYANFLAGLRPEDRAGDPKVLQRAFQLYRTKY